MICEQCGELTDHLGLCPYEDCEHQRELCHDCLYIHITEHFDHTTVKKEIIGGAITYVSAPVIVYK